MEILRLIYTIELNDTMHKTPYNTALTQLYGTIPTSRGGWFSQIYQSIPASIHEILQALFSAVWTLYQSTGSWVPVCEICKGCSFQCDMGKYSTEYGVSLKANTLLRYCIFPYSTKMSNVCFFLRPAGDTVMTLLPCICSANCSERAIWTDTNIRLIT